MLTLLGLFSLLFTALKLTGHIQWSWAAVLWMPFAIAVMTGVLIGASSV